MDTDGRELPNQVTKEANQVLVCPCEESMDEQLGDLKQVKANCQGIHGKVCYVKSPWPGCEVKHVGDLSLLQYHSHISHMHPWQEVVIANGRWILCGGDAPPMTA